MFMASGLAAWDGTGSSLTGILAGGLPQRNDAARLVTILGWRGRNSPPVAVATPRPAVRVVVR